MFGKRIRQRLGGCLPDPILAGLPVINDVLATASDKPSKFSLQDKMPSAILQLNFDCVGAASAYLGEFFEQQETGQWQDLSAMAVFSLAKAKDGLPRESGTYLSNATYIPEKYGYFFEKDYPEKGGDVYTDFPQHLKDQALRYRIKKSVLVDRGLEVEGITNMLWTIKTPVVIGIDVYDNFQPDSDGIIPRPQSNSKLLYGHAMTVVGFDDDEHLLQVLNSWGRGWGKDGYCYLPYNFPLYATAWTGYDMENPPLPSSEIAARDLAKEQRNAELLKAAIYKAFAATDRARLIAAKNWFVYVEAISYKGFSIIDVINDCYSISRNKGPIFTFKDHR